MQVGCCGFPVSKHRYFECFGAVEIQKTFYDPPPLNTASRWREEAPPGFEFALKAWQVITHGPESPTYKRLQKNFGERKNYGFFRPTREVRKAWEITRDFALALGAKAVLFQCPASFTPTDENISNMRSFFKSADGNDLLFFWEPRGIWEPELVWRICEELGLNPAGDPFIYRIPEAPVMYYRLHGRGGYRYQYTKYDLSELARMIRPGTKGYCFFNNRTMFEDALRFKELLGSSAMP